MPKQTRNKPKHLPGVRPTVIQRAGPASLCSLYIRKFCATPSGNQEFGGGTGFHYRDAEGHSWLVTNWHVLTGRRPDAPEILINGLPRSPFRISISYPGPIVGQFLPAVTLDLYDDGRPIWRQSRLDLGLDIAAIPIKRPPGAISPFIQDFAERDESALIPGLDVAVIGFPFEHGTDTPFPIWKRAMVASEPAYMVFGAVQTLLDTPGSPGMSGSPVYRLSQGIAVSAEQHAAFNSRDFGSGRALELLESFSGDMQETVMLRWIGVYAGARGVAGMEKLSLGRMMMASAVDMATMHGEPGHNPFPPTDCDPVHD